MCGHRFEFSSSRAGASCGERESSKTDNCIQTGSMSDLVSRAPGSKPSAARKLWPVQRIGWMEKYGRGAGPILTMQVHSIRRTQLPELWVIEEFFQDLKQNEVDHRTQRNGLESHKYFGVRPCHYNARFEALSSPKVRLSTSCLAP